MFSVFVTIGSISCNILYCIIILVHTTNFRAMKTGEDQDMFGGEVEFVV